MDQRELLLNKKSWDELEKTYEMISKLQHECDVVLLIRDSSGTQNLDLKTSEKDELVVKLLELEKKFDG